MLVLTRKTGQKLIIGDNIEIIILETKGESVKIGIKAPRNITVYREEIFEEIKKANEQSTRNVLIADLDLAFNLFETKKKKKD
jgi:carbon storage regulator